MLLFVQWVVQSKINGVLLLLKPCDQTEDDYRWVSLNLNKQYQVKTL